MMQADLFGAPPKPPGTKKQRRQNGYAAQPGTGPKGETCRSCVHYTHKTMAKTYRKCGLMRHAWTGGYGTDILARAPACRFWEKGP